VIRVKELSQVKPGDFVYHHGVLEVVRSVDAGKEKLIVTLESNEVIEVQAGDNTVFYSMKPKLP
jgi:hypothetical protein